MTTAELTFESVIPGYLLLTAILVALVVVGYGLWRRLPHNLAGLTVTFLRVAFLVLLFWVLPLPGRKSALTEIVKPRFIVLLDRSASMNQSADETAGRTRWQAAMDMLGRPWLKNVQASCVLDIFPFHVEVESSLTPEEAAAAEADGRSTFLNLALQRLFERMRGQELAGVMVLTDALDTREKSDQWAETRWPAPIYAVLLEQPGEADDTPDMRVDQVDTPRRAIVGWDTVMTITVAGQGGKGETFPVIVLKDGKEIERVPTQVPVEGGSREIQIKLPHPAVGVENYLVRVPPLPGEVQTNDNEMVVAVDVLDAKNRVLFLEDVPRFESKHLSRALFDNKDITPLAFFQMPSQKNPGAKEWVAYGDRQGLSFDLTLEQLKQNKIIILGDFDSSALLPEHCRTILEFVEQGGSLILLGGQKLWGDNGIVRTDLAKLLPFRRSGAPAIEGRFNTSWTAEGRAHPALASNEELPASLPPVLSVFSGATLAGGALVLVEAESGGGTNPILVSSVYGQGKVLAVLTDSLWRWVMQPGGEKPYPLFWRQIVQWMSPSASDTEKYHLELFTDAGTISVGDPAILQARLVTPPEDSRRSRRVSCEITTPSDRKMNLAMTSYHQQSSGGGSGYMAEFAPNEPGNYRVVAMVEVDGRKIESAACLFNVRATSAETALKPVNDKVLKALARSSGGRFGTLDEIDATLRDLRVQERREHKLEYRSLWQNPWILGCLLALLALEWLSRKLQNLA